MRSGTMTPRAAVHSSLWYEDPWYRLAWLALPQAGTVLLANLLFALVAQGEWGRPTTGSRQRAAELEILRDRAGGEGDAAALNQLAAGAKAGEIDAQTRLATLYDPLVAGRFPRKTVPSDRARATELYRAGSEAGDLMAMARLADLLLEEAVSEDDRRRGCRLAKAWLDHPATTRDMLRGEERLAEKLARCLVDAESGIPQDPRRAGDLIVDTLRLKYEPSIRTYVRGLGLHKPALIRALQEAMAARTIGRYTGPVDGLVHPETIAALEREAGLRPFLPEPAPERRAAIGTGLTAEEFRSLAQAATRDLAALARVQAIADRGDATALATLGYLYSPFLNKGEVFAPDAQRSAANFERAAAAGARDAAAQAAGLYDKGAGALEKDPDRAASLILRQLELDPGYQTFLTDPVFGATWSPAFWGALQRALAARGIYTNPVENRRNDAVIAAIRRFAQANGTARSPSRP